MEDDNRISITVCGDGGCGKSSITLRLVRSQWTSEYDPTIEDSYSVTRHIDGKTYHLSLTDTAGQEEYRGLWATSNLKSDAFLLVYDITQPQTLAALGHYADLIAIETDARIDHAAVAPVKMVVGNKCDLKEKRQITSVEGFQWAKRRGCGFMETSAREMWNIEETFASLVRNVVKQRREHATGRPHAAGQTAPLTPLADKEGPEYLVKSGFDDEDERGGRRRGFMAMLKSLKCW